MVNTLPTWYSLLGFTWNSIVGEARCGVFLRNRVTYRAHLPLDIFGGWHFSISPLTSHHYGNSPYFVKVKAIYCGEFKQEAQNISLMGLTEDCSPSSLV